MAETQLAPIRTPLNVDDTYDAVRVAWLAQVGSEPTRPQLLTLLAQVWLETGAGASSFNYNLGGIKHVPGDGHDFYTISTHEGAGAASVVVTAPFRAYSSLSDAASDYVHVLRTTYGFAWPAIEAADTAAYAHALKQRGYYTAAEHDYATGLAARYAQLLHQLQDTNPDSPRAIAASAPGLDADGLAALSPDTKDS